MSSLVPCLFFLVLLAVSLLTLPAFHPIQLYSAPWAAATTLYALKLLPYRALSWSAVAFICGAGAVFTAAVLVGASSWRRNPRKPHPAPPLTAATRSAGQTQLVAAARGAAWTATLLGAPLFLVFLLQMASRFGVFDALLVAKGVREALVGEGPPRSVLYERLAFPAAALWSLAAALAPTSRARRRYLLGCGCAVVSLYFSTGRELVVNAALIATAIQVALWSRRSSFDVAKAATAVTVGALALFIGVGALGGHTFRKSGIWTFDNFFTRHEAFSALSLPYEDLSAPIAAFDIRLAATGTWGHTYGCALAARECSLLRELGANVQKPPAAPPFTGPPLQWNAYTYLDAFLLDGGKAAAVLPVAILGLFVGFAWRAARRRSYYGIIAYAFCVPVVVFSYRQNLLDAFLLDALTTAVIFHAWCRWERRTSASRPSRRQFWTVRRTSTRGWGVRTGGEAR
jgi:oligosaccharide repeat unit polymerase